MEFQIREASMGLKWVALAFAFSVSIPISFVLFIKNTRERERGIKT